VPEPQLSAVADAPLEADGAALRDRLLDATVASVASVGVARTTVADVARMAGCSRASAYRLFPGKRGLILEAAHRELARFEAGLARGLAEASSLEDALVLGLVESHRFLAGHTALQYVFEHEPGVVLPFFGFKHIDTLYAMVGAYSAEQLARFLPVELGGWAGEWIARTVLSYQFHASGDLDLATPADARRVVRRYLLPALDPSTLTSSPT
jgi:AcrR family transcriptional regulator